MNIEAFEMFTNFSIHNNHLYVKAIKDHDSKMTKNSVNKYK